MKRFTQCISLVLALVLFLSVPVYAAESTMPRASNFFMASSTYLWKVSSTTFEVWFDIDAVRGMDELGASEIKVQRSSDGVNWTTMYTYTKELYPHLIAEDTGSHCGYVTYTGSTGYYYRAFVTYYAKDSTGTAEAYRYTSSLKL